MLKKFKSVGEINNYLNGLNEKGLNILERDFNSFANRNDNNILIDIRETLLSLVDTSNRVVKLDCREDILSLKTILLNIKLINLIFFEKKLRKEEEKQFNYFISDLHKLINNILNYSIDIN